MSDDPRLDAVRYRLDRLAGKPGTPTERLAEEQEAEREETERRERARARLSAAQIGELSIQQAIRRGDFDELPGAGKPLSGLTDVRDPDWWIRRKIERERLTGLGPPALTLRTEDAELDVRLDRLFREEEVREALADFNARIVEARRQLLGGPPVVTPTREVEEEVRAWRARRDERIRRERVAREREEAERAEQRRRRRWWRR